MTCQKLCWNVISVSIMSLAIHISILSAALLLYSLLGTFLISFTLPLSHDHVSSPHPSSPHVPPSAPKLSTHIKKTYREQGRLDLEVFWKYRICFQELWLFRALFPRKSSIWCSLELGILTRTKPFTVIWLTSMDPLFYTGYKDSHSWFNIFQLNFVLGLVILTGMT